MDSNLQSSKELRPRVGIASPFLAPPIPAGVLGGFMPEDLPEMRPYQPTPTTAFEKFLQVAMAAAPVISEAMRKPSRRQPRAYGPAIVQGLGGLAAARRIPEERRQREAKGQAEYETRRLKRWSETERVGQARRVASAQERSAAAREARVSGQEQRARERQEALLPLEVESQRSLGYQRQQAGELLKARRTEPGKFKTERTPPTEKGMTDDQILDNYDRRVSLVEREVANVYSDAMIQTNDENKATVAAEAARKRLTEQYLAPLDPLVKAVLEKTRTKMGIQTEGPPNAAKMKWEPAPVEDYFSRLGLQVGGL